MTTDKGLRTALALLIAFASVACSDEAKERPSASASVSASAPAPKTSKLTGFTAKLDGKELILDSALAFSRGGSALHFTISTHPLDCTKIGGAGFRLEPGEFLVDFTVAPITEPGGGADAPAKWMITGSRLGDVSRQGTLGKAKMVAGDPRKLVKVNIDQAKLNFMPFELELDGKLGASGCGIIPVTERAKVRRQPVKVELDGKTLIMNGASIIKSKGGRSLRLTSEPHACAKGVAGSDVAIELSLDASDEVTRTRVSGFSIARPLLTKPTEPGVSATFGKNTDDGQEVNLSGQLSLAGHALIVEGLSRVEICP